MSVMRLDKCLAEMSFGTRKEVKSLIKKGYVSVNQSSNVTPEQKVDTCHDQIQVCGKLVEFTGFEYFMLNKPQGYVSATKDNLHPTVLELIQDKKRKDLFPVGRLDIDTEGLLLITNDGKLANHLLAPRHHVGKTYFVRVDGCVDEEDITLFAKGMDIGDDRPTRPAQIEILKAGETSEVMVAIVEGRYHQVKRMFAAIGKPVLYLRRMAMGSLVLDDTLALGSYRRLTEEEIQKLWE